MAAKKKSKTEATAEVPEIPVPSYTISADSKFGVECMIAVTRVAARMALPREDQRAIAVKLREFDLYEEMTRE